MFRNYKRCYCMNNEYKNNENNNEYLKNIYENIDMNYNNTNRENCYCGFDDDNVFPVNPKLGQSYVPIQYMDKTFKPCVGLKMGTLFPELVSPYVPCQSMEENQYIRDTNEIKEGCNKWK